MILDNFQKGFFLEEMVDKNKQTQVNTMDFLNFIRPDTRSQNAEMMYGKAQSSIATPHILSPETKQVKWDDIFAGNNININASTRASKKVFDYGVKPVNPRFAMKQKVKKGNTQRMQDNSTKSSK